ncbi:Uncharacterised protein [Mycobacterium tuberculosis]|uniref:Uncharacterized protein n=1 Tax=Mycobacterium tuberculosis TaxID=1773 RepID=A0A655IJC1_MYCTX|nr:Uncharacterised protein [Mycobacterium tuberculosis]CKR55940.1 Uncharacterised protein [Mycobacterium tuberculosis]CNU31564.1 Uncharacterised protein [Mycobacterium tuberculosis]CNU47507.1 Uncharacterised protein [Mycobacterium tuberculosis]COV36631.1 Uncharacterised protein [Mycobacterium tuberculosis]
MPAVAAGRRGVGLRGLAVVRPHAVSHRYRHLSDGRSSLAGRASAVWRWCVVPHTHRAEPPVHLSSTGGRPVQPIRLVADAGCQRRDHGANPGAADRVDGDRADRPRRMANLPTGTRAGSVTPVVVGRAHRGSGNDLAGADQLELRFRSDQCGADDPGDRRLLPTPNAMATRADVGAGDSPQTHPRGVSPLLPATSGRSGRADGAGVVRGRHAARFRPGVARLLGVLDAYPSPHGPDRRCRLEHRPEHRGRTRAVDDWR